MALLSRWLQRQRIAAVSPYLRGKILDLGCGSAALAEQLGPGQSYTGVEVQADLIERIRATYPQHDFVHADLDTDALGLEDRAYDTVAMCAVVEHLRRPENVLRQVSLALAKNGRLLITTPSPLGDLAHGIGARLGLFSKEAVKEHQRIYQRRAMQDILRGHGFVVMTYRTFGLWCNQLFVARRMPNHEDHAR